MIAVAHELGKSHQLRSRALARTPGGVHSNVRLTGVTASRVLERGQGAWLYDVDGREYLDYLLGQGPSFLGHAPRPVLDAVAQASNGGLILGGQHELEVKAAELLCECLRWPEMVRFSTTGTEAVQAALRLARGTTGRRKVIRFEGHYHGWLDNVLISEKDGSWGPASVGQLDADLTQTLVVPWNDIDALSEIFRAHGVDIAAVITEPIMINTGVIEPRPGYLDAVRRLCSRNGSVLIFDEVISGFRLCLGGATDRYRVTPDLAIYGKALGGGYAVSALAGRADLMHQFGTGRVTHAGTFNGCVPAMAAVVATLTQLRDHPPYSTIVGHGTPLMRGLRELGKRYGLPLRVEGLPMAFHVSFGDAEVTDYRSLQSLDLERYAAFTDELVDEGLWVAARGIWYVSAAHGATELDAALTRFEAALKRIQ